MVVACQHLDREENCEIKRLMGTSCPRKQAQGDSKSSRGQTCPLISSRIQLLHILRMYRGSEQGK